MNYLTRKLFIHLFLPLDLEGSPSPLQGSQSYLIELAIKAAQEDINGIVCIVGSVILFATGHFIVGSFFSVYTVIQCIYGSYCADTLRFARRTLAQEGARQIAEKKENAQTP